MIILLCLSRGLFIGRFQPFHLGHKACIDFALQRVDELIIGIGSPQLSFEPKNPFTGGERLLMIKQSLNAESTIDQRRILIVPIPDIHMHSLWTYHVKILVPSFEFAFVNDPLSKLLFTESGTKIIEPPLQSRDELSGTVIRMRMVEDIDWTHLVSEQTGIIIRDIRGVERMKKLHSIGC